MASWPSFTWDTAARQYRDSRGKFVPRRQVRQALDEAIERAKGRIAADARALQAGAINLPEWQLRTEASLKTIHTMTAAVAAGGWAQATAKDWAAAGNRLKKQYRYLERFAKQIENGLPLDGRFLRRAESYAAAGSGTYEAVVRRRELATAMVVEERRLLHSSNPCVSCLAYQSLGWQPPGVLPDIGEECQCGMRCQCAFQRRTLALSSIKFTPSDRARRDKQQTVWVDVARLDAAFQREAGYAIGPQGAGAVPGRLEGFRTFLKDAATKGTPIGQPEVTIGEDGSVGFINGRHRFAVLRDIGLRKIPVSVARASVALARRLFGVEQSDGG